MKNAVLIASLSAAVLTGATAQTVAAGNDMHRGHHGMRPTFEELDADGDGRVTQAELQSRMQARFESADADGDGKLSRAEMSARIEARQAERRAQMLERMFEHRDEDGDGALTLEEMRRDRAERMFARMDEDGDGALSREEFEAMRDRHHMRHGAQGGHRHGHDGKYGEE